MAVLIVVTAAMLTVRARLQEAHVALVYLLVVLGASASMGRAFGLGLAGAAFVLLDWFFLPPYGTILVANPLDWLVLVAFFGTSAVAAQLLYQARRQAEIARARAAEIDRLAVLGAETLNAVRAEDAMPAIADVIRATVDAEWCEVYLRPGEGAPVMLGARSPARDRSPDRDGREGREGREATSVPPPHTDGDLVQWVADHGGEAAQLADGTWRVSAASGTLRSDVAAVEVPVAPSKAGGPGPSGIAVRALYLPLRVRDRVVGVVGIGATPVFRLDAANRRVLRALSYYAALGAERVRLAGDAEHARALREADRLKDALLASVSHDLRTPLTTIKALANAIARTGDERARTIEDEADRLNRFVENLLDLSRLQAGGPSRPPVPNDAEDLVGAALQRISGRSAGREVRVHVVPADGVPLTGRFDFTDTLRAFVNLLENALKYSPPACPVDLTVRRDGPWLAFEVADRGVGVAEADRERIFQPFNRPATSPPDVGGAGLGLSIARSLAAAQGGSVTLAPREGGGSTFTLRVQAFDPTPLDSQP